MFGVYLTSKLFNPVWNDSISLSLTLRFALTSNNHVIYKRFFFNIYIFIRLNSSFFKHIHQHIKAIFRPILWVITCFVSSFLIRVYFIFFCFIKVLKAINRFCLLTETLKQEQNKNNLNFLGIWWFLRIMLIFSFFLSFFTYHFSSFLSLFLSLFKW